MANMGYCRFQNTYLDLLDCYENMENIDEASSDEKRAFDRIIKLCKNIANEFGDGEL